MPHGTCNAPRSPLVRRIPVPGGELRIDPSSEERLAELGLLDPGVWGDALPGRRIQAAEGRRVHRVSTPAGRLFLKHEERRSLWSTRLPARWTSGAAANERASELLGPLGVRTPHLHLAGERSAAGRRESFLVSGELLGKPLTPELLAETPEVVQALGTFLARLGEARIEVPDLYGKHLTWDPAADAPLGLLDLDRVRPAARPQGELLVRHAAGLIATLPGLAPATLLASCGISTSPALLARVEARADDLRGRKKMPHDYGARTRYADPAEVRAYQARRPSRHRAEIELLESVLPDPCTGRILDAPCGAGRCSEVLALRGATPLALDLSPAMVATAAHAAQGALVGELERLPLVDDAVRGVLCFRFLHHVPTAAQRRRILGELTRVARDFVVLSFFHPVSAHNALRRARRLVGGSRTARYSQTRGRLTAELGELGWEVRAVKAQARWRRDLWILRAEPRRT